MKQICMLLVLVFVGAFSFPAFGGEPGFLTSLELKSLMDGDAPGLVLIDSRSRSQFDLAHIRGAISLPLEEMEKDVELPRVRKDARVVFYCSGIT